MLLNVSEDLIKRCKKEDRRAQFELYKECYGSMMSICLRYHSNNDDAKNVLNQAFFKVCTNLDQRKQEVPFEQWLKRITINTCIDEYRKTRSKLDRPTNEDFNERIWDMKVNEYNTGEQEMNAESLRELIRCLPPISQ
ncbi:MAG: sigma factor [Salibacteraceae bacterium]